MYKVLIVDDELLLQTNIKLIINWEENGFVICGEASDGIEALNIIETEIPDIVICDVRMPNLDGLQLIRKINTEYPDIKFIMLSNYDDFEYVRDTLKSGALDYILKHNLNNKLLLDVLLRAKRLIEETLGSKRKSNAESLSSGNLTALREKFIIQLLTGLYRDTSEIKNHLLVLDMKIDINNAVAILMVIDDYRITAANQDLKDSSLQEFAVDNICSEILDDFGNGAICHVSNEKYAILLSFANSRSRSLIDNAINSVLGRIGTCLKKFLNLSVSFCVGSMCESISNIDVSYENAQRLLVDKFFYGNNCILKNSHQESQKKLVMGINIDIERQIVLKIRQKDKKGLTLELLQVFDFIERDKLSIKSSKMIFNDLLGIINRMCKENAVGLGEVYSEELTQDEIVTSLETLDTAKIWFLKVFEKLMSLINSREDGLNSLYVKKAVEFIKRNYAENISLGQIADSLDITDNYLSKLFKEEVGIGFAEYLCDIRLEMAKNFLEEGKKDIKTVSEICGFNNYAYFFNVFKKKIGITPKKYLKGKLKS